MGRATRWLKNFFGGWKDRNDGVDDRKEKRRWSFKSSRDSVDTPRRIPLADTPWLRALYAEAEKEQSKHAIAVAAATAAAADAAVAAAEAAVAVVRLTRNGTKTTFSVEEYRLSAAAAVKIQTFFRGYLAKKALRALKSLVKLQALVRGYLIRKRAHATLHSMEALIRAQSIVRAQTFKSKSKPIISLKSLQTFNNDENRMQNTPSMDWSPKIVEIDTGRPSLHVRPLTPECRCSFTANSTPRYMNSLGGLVPPYVSPNYPNYMSNTLASEAKVRWQSVPKQRPELSRSRKRIPLGEVVIEQSRASLSSLGKQRPCFQEESLSFRSDVVGTKVDRSLEFYLQRKW